jgi:hypothetical protein
MIDCMEFHFCYRSMQGNLVCIIQVLLHYPELHQLVMKSFLIKISETVSIYFFRCMGGIIPIQFSSVERVCFNC